MKADARTHADNKVAEDEGHGFRKKANEDVYLETVAMFLNKLKVSK